jgi:hypothetical protein
MVVSEGNVPLELVLVDNLCDTCVEHALAPTARILDPKYHLLPVWPGVDPGHASFYLLTLRPLNLFGKRTDRTLAGVGCD